MALVNNGVKNSLPDTSIPSGYTRPSVTEFTDFQYTYEEVLTVLKATVENATRSTTMANIIADAAIGLTKKINDEMTKDYDIVGNAVTVWADWTHLTNNFTSLKSDGDVLSNIAPSYYCTVKVYIKVV